VDPEKIEYRAERPGGGGFDVVTARANQTVTWFLYARNTGRQASWRLLGTTPVRVYADAIRAAIDLDPNGYEWRAIPAERTGGPPVEIRHDEAPATFRAAVLNAADTAGQALVIELYDGRRMRGHFWEM
jgi:hypothetical protein